MKAAIAVLECALADTSAGDQPVRRSELATALGVLRAAHRPAYQQRVIAEKENLDSRIDSLAAFLGSPTFHGLPGDERERLRRQIGLMRGYSSVLEERVEAFDVIQPPPR